MTFFSHKSQKAHFFFPPSEKFPIFAPSTNVQHMTGQRYISPEIVNSNVKHFREGKEEGLREGLKEGERKKSLEIARKLKAAGVADAVILATTGLDENELKSL